MTAYEQDSEVVRWGLQLFDGDPYSNCGYCSTITPGNGDFFGGHYITDDGYVMDCGDIDNDELIAQALQEELSQLAVAEMADSADEGLEQLQPFPETLNASCLGGYGSGQEEAEYISHSSSCSSPGEEVYFPEEWPCTGKIPHDYVYDGEVGKRLNQMICVPHTPKTNGEIPSVNEATLHHQRLLQRLQLYGLVEHKVKGDGNCHAFGPNIYLNTSIICMFRALSDQIYYTPEHHEFIRQEIMKQLKSCRDIYEGYVPMAYDDYFEKMSKTGEWGDHVTLQAAADLHGVRIFVITSFKDTCYIEILPKDQRSKRVIFLSFWAEVHYNSIHLEEDVPASKSKKKKGWRKIRNKRLECPEEY